MTTKPESQSGPWPATNPEEFRASPIGNVYGIVDDPADDVPAVTAALLELQVPLEGIHVYCCDEGIAALDPAGTEHGLRARITRMLQSVTYNDDHLKTIESHLEAGHALIGIAADETNKDLVAAVLRRHHAHDVVYYGPFTWERLSATSRPPPSQ